MARNPPRMGSDWTALKLENMAMKKLWTRVFAPLLALSLIAVALPAFAKDKTEDELIADLSASKASVVTSALQNLEKHFPTSTNAFPKIKGLLTDSRAEVRVKAARVLGSLHAPVDSQDIQAIENMLKSSDKKEKMGALIALRGLTAPEAVPLIVPLLQDKEPYVIRDACRTLAVLGNKDLVPQIEPLLKYPDSKVQKDAMDAIATLKAKP
jgi:HEAT repeat protein